MPAARLEESGLGGDTGRPAIHPDAASTRDVALDELVTRTRGPQPWRRVLHVLCGLLVAWFPDAWGLSRLAVVGVLAGLLALVLVADFARLRAPRLNAAFFASFPSMASPREARGLASSTWYLVGVLSAWAVFPRHVVVPAILVLALADPAASALGRAMGRHRFGKGTLEGSAAFLLVALAVLTLSVGWAPALVVAAGATMVEVLPWRLDDNLTLPVATAALLWIFGA